MTDSGVSIDSIRRAERGDPVSIDTARSICSHLNVDYRELVEAAAESQSEQIREYVYCDRSRIDSYSSQFLSRASRSKNPIENIPKLISALRARRQLQTNRPNSYDHRAESIFVLESFTASKIIFPRHILEPSDYADIAVWVSPPSDPPDSLRGKWEAAGTFLYLVEAHTAGGMYKERFVTAASGYSSLKMTLRFLEGGECQASCRS
jgi:hypothetical protein